MSKKNKLSVKEATREYFRLEGIIASFNNDKVFPNFKTVRQKMKRLKRIMDGSKVEKAEEK